VSVEAFHFHDHALKALTEIVSKKSTLSITLTRMRWLIFFLLFIRRKGLTPDQEVVEKHIADLNGKLDVYDKILSKQKYLAGEVRDKFLLLADIAH
jgi:glutathione S-transferase